MKKRVSFLVGILLSASIMVNLVGCANNGGQNQSNGTDKTTETQNTQVVTDTETETQNTEDVEVVYDEITSDASIVEYTGVVVIGDACFELYNYGDNTAQNYAATVTGLADSLDGVANVYSIPVPLGSGIVFPDNLRDQVTFSDQGEAVSSILGHMGESVNGVNIYGSLMEHRSEYLYFRTDHHWTQLGAYYAYEEFCEVKGVEAESLDSDAFTPATYDGFIGSFYFNNTQDTTLKNNPDTIYAYIPTANATMTVTDVNGTTFDWPIVKDVTDYKAGTKYSCYIAGDNPFVVIENADITDGSSCVVIKDSFGNAFVPYLVNHYQTVYVIDFRHWTGNLATFVQDNGVDDVIFLNNISAICNSYLVGKLKGIMN